MHGSHAGVSPLLAAIEAAATEAWGAGAAVRGRLRVDVEPFFARLVLAPRLPGFLERHPGIDLDLVTRGKAGDLVRDGIDVALRFGPPSVLSTVCAPSARHTRGHRRSPGLPRASRPPGHAGRPRAAHRCIQVRHPATGRPFARQFVRGSETVDVPGRGAAMTLGDVGLTLDTCLAGVDIAQVLALGTRPLLAAGRLVDLFPDWPDETFPLHAVYPSRHQPPAKVRAFVDLCLAAVRGDDPRDGVRRRSCPGLQARARSTLDPRRAAKC